MTSSVQKSMVAKVVGLSLVMLLAACSSDQRHKRQVSGDESYLKAPQPRTLVASAGMILPVQNGDYEIPAASSTGELGKALDIRPPLQPLALLSGSRTQISGDTATLLIENSAQANRLWPQVVQIVQDKGYVIASRQDASQTLTTDWIFWPRDDESVPYRARYQISEQPQGYQVAVVVKLLGLEVQNTPVAEALQVQRYTSLMANTLSDALEKQAAARENAQINRAVGTLDVLSGADDSGLPLLVVRGPYSVVWDRLPAALEKVGMKVNDRSRPQGSIALTYNAPGSSAWERLGAKDPELTNGDYKLQVGDLGNRSTLQFIDSKGHTLSQSKNDALVAVFQAALSH